MTNINQKSRSWEVQVQEFGITKQVMSFLNMEGSSDNHHVSYPCQFPPRIDYDESNQVIYPETWRSRVLPDALVTNPDQARFFQIEGEDLPMFYTPNYEALRQAVSISNGELHMFEGDKDTWTALAAGYFNSVGLFSAGTNMTEELGYQLKAIGVKTIRYYPDADHAGWHLAERLLAIMTKSDIRVNVFHLPLYIRGQRIKDTSDVWLAVEQNPELYNQMLRGLRQLVLPSQVNLERAKDGEGIFNADFYNQIEIALGITKYKNGGWSDYTKCIFHDHSEDDTDPKFGWNKNYHIARCFKCGETWLAKDVAEKIGIDWKKYVNSGRDKDKVPSITSPSTSLETPARQLEQAKASELKIANNLFGGINAESNFADIPSSEFMYTLDEALDNYALRLVGALPTAYPPLPNPIKPMHKLGGNARIITRPTMIGVLGVSGGFKTSLLQGVSNKYSQDGYHGIIYSPEWSPERNADRIIQQMGGMKMSQMSLLARYYYEQSMIDKGILASDDTSVFGEKPDESVMLKSESAISYVRNAFRGKIVYLKDFGSSILDILAMTKEAYKRMADAGYTPSYFIFDYAQMAEPPMNWPGRWDMQMTIKQTKKLTMELGLITWMASQVRKSDTEDLAGADGDILTSTSGLNFHDHQFNLFLTVNPMKEIIVFPNGRRLREVKLAVTKNSEGDKADTKDLAISMFVDLDRMLMLEYANENAPVLFAITSNDPDLKEALEDSDNTRSFQVETIDTGIAYESEHESEYEAMSESMED